MEFFRQRAKVKVSKTVLSVSNSKIGLKLELSSKGDHEDISGNQCMALKRKQGTELGLGLGAGVAYTIMNIVATTTITVSVHPRGGDTALVNLHVHLKSHPQFSCLPQPFSHPVTAS